jgi:hypothetical protein
MGEVEFDRPTTTRLEIHKQQSVLRGEHVARVRLAVQQLKCSDAVVGLAARSGSLGRWAG